ncbi:MAG: diaminopimelate decarboxylase [Chloroflexi bacterium]|nr:diaminopimelate decarboxylase [Chloroflexota bacterium]
MTPFQYKQNILYCEDTPLANIVDAVGTPVYVYSQAELLHRATTFQVENSLACYAVKANGNPTLLHLLGQAGMGADVTSGGELFLALHAGISPEKIIYSGVGKLREEISHALKTGIRALHVESAMELETVAEVARQQQTIASIGVRVNPNIAVETHPYISTGQREHKFGVAPDTAVALLHFAQQHPWLQPVSLAAHIGSQITDLSPFVESAHFLVKMAHELAESGIRLQYLDVGGGLGIDYEDRDWRLEIGDSTPQSPIANLQSLSIAEWVTAVSQPILQAGYEVVMEPGRSIVAPTGALLTKVVYTKPQGDKEFLIVDAGMNDLLRPTLYKAHHPIWPVNGERLSVIGNRLSVDGEQLTYDVVGPICETGDFLAKARSLPRQEPGNLLAVMQAGAYGFAMASNYNGRPRPAEVLVNGNQYSIIRQRQTYDHLLDGNRTTD